MSGVDNKQSTTLTHWEGDTVCPLSLSETMVVSSYLSWSSSSATTSLSFLSSSLFLSSFSSCSSRHPKLASVNTPTTTTTIQRRTLRTLSITAQLATLPVLSYSGDKVGETFLDLKSAPPDTARAVVHRAIITDQQNARRGTASSLTRAEVRGGGKKPYQQKKTGRARRGSQRSPLRPGGGVVFGPKPKDWSIKINKKEKRLAISTALDSAAAAQSVFVVEEFGDKFEKPKTKEFIEAMKRWGLDPKMKTMFLMGEVSDNVRLSSRNIGTLSMLTPRTLNLFDILNSDKLVLTPAAVDYLNGRYGVDIVKDGAEEEEEEEEEEVEEEEEGSSEG